MESPFNSQPHETPPIQERAQFEEERNETQKYFIEKIDPAIKELTSLYNDLAYTLRRIQNLTARPGRSGSRFSEEEIQKISQSFEFFQSKFENFKSLLQRDLVSKFGIEISNKYIIESLAVDIDAYVSFMTRFISTYKPLIDDLYEGRKKHEETLPRPPSFSDLS